MAEMKKTANPITMFFTDIHLKESNCEEVKKVLIGQGIDLCKKWGISECFCLGDVFDSRVAQKQIVLSTWSEILDVFNDNKIAIHCIRGNHDSSDYRSSESFLDPFKYHPNFNLISDIELIVVRGFEFYCIAYWDEDIWLDRFKDLKSVILQNPNIVCLGHQAITGSTNKGYSTENRLKLSMFDEFRLTLMGHFHDYQRIGDKFYHIGSLMQNNFGEDEQKGFWILFDDYQLRFEPSQTKKFKKLEIDLNEISDKQVDKLIKDFKKKNEDDFLRIEFKGDKDAIEVIDKKKYRDLGIDIKTKVNDLEITEGEVLSEIRTLSDKDIIEKFKIWCKENEYEVEQGLSILEEVL